MADNYLARARITGDDEFVARVRVAAIQVALGIKGEAATNPPLESWKKRNYLADRILQQPPRGDDVLTWMVWAVVSEAGVTPTESTDANLFAAVTAVWNDVAGVTDIDDNPA